VEGLCRSCPAGVRWFGAEGCVLCLIGVMDLVRMFGVSIGSRNPELCGGLVLLSFDRIGA
jgi:hypothetical protein